jgi:hypothetical protein
MGFYVSGDYQFARRWFLGGRYDNSQRIYNSGLRDTGGSAIVTYWPSEFSQIRAQYRRTNYAPVPESAVGNAAPASTASELLFQFQFSIGAHGAHPF